MNQLEEPSAGEREGLAPRMREPSAGEREGPAPRMKEPSAGEREGPAPRMKEPSAGERQGPVPRMNMQALQASLPRIQDAPKDGGRLEMIVRRPRTDERETLQEGFLDLAEGLVGDNWRTKGSPMTEDGAAHPDMQLNIMNARVTQLVAGTRERWPLAGDQLYLDMDLSLANLPPGTRLQLGEALIEVTPPPHTGCRKFVDRFGLDAMKFVNSRQGRKLNLRGINAKVIEPGTIRVGNLARKVG